MAFNLEEKIKNKNFSEERNKNHENVKIGVNLLSDSEQIHIGSDTLFIPRNKIIKNSENFYSIKQIRSLANSIKIFGMSAPLEVKPLEDRTFILTGGERRLTAIDLLIEENKWSQDVLISCVVKNPRNVQLPLTKFEKETLAMITTNKETRKYSDGDLYKETQRLKPIIIKLRENGVEYLSEYENEDKETAIKIKGRKTRDILSDMMDVSTGKINQISKIKNQGAPELKKALAEDKISINAAEKAVSCLTQQEQTALAKDSYKKNISVSNIKDYTKRNVTNEQISIQKFQNDISEITSTLKKAPIKLNDKEAKEYHSIINKLKKLLKY